VFQNLRLALEAAGATFAHVIKLTVFVTDMAYLPAVREVRNEHVDVERPPASTAVQVSALFRPEYLVEIDALAVVGA
jgi:enamine deaminase RidA (YjgF/YER057c/UK114 family)